MSSYPSPIFEFRLRWFFVGFIVAFCLAYILTGDPKAFSEPIRAILKKYVVPDEGSAVHVFTFSSLVALFLSGWAGVTCTNLNPAVTRHTNKTIKGFLVFSGILLGHFFGYGAWHFSHTGFSLSTIGLLSYFSLIVLQPIWLVSSVFSVVELVGSGGLKPWQQKLIPYFRVLCFGLCLVAVGGGINEYLLKGY
ncbi:hypothetical protein ABGV49_20065 [Chromobacterium vaccinii]|uniref:Uncharacterized protein n=1 Tax=Chromobacterium vaccinii TaxID=1108595 RepID=A0ABV0FGZ2_9NEIS